MLPEHDLKVIKERLGREPNIPEQACFLNLWSEHCSYRSSAPLLKTLPTEGPNVILGPGDDAALVRLPNGQVLAIGMESHNHPSYVDPYNGAATGIGGIVRDVLSMGCRPIALMDPLYFGTLSKEKNRYLFEYVVQGIGDYGNCIGVPTVGGEVVFDDSYSGNPLVNVVCIGLGEEKDIKLAVAQKAGNHLVLMGSTTGRDGLGGASFASRDLSEESESEDRSSVQVGDPFTEKIVIEATLEAVHKGLVVSCRDLGAAGLVGATSEMVARGNLGLYLNLNKVHLREEGMTPMEILVAESQERMALEVRPEDVEAVKAIADKYDIRASDIGLLIEEPNYVAELDGEVVVDIPIQFLTAGAPTFERPSSKRPELQQETKPPMPSDLKDAVLRVLASPNVASKEWVYRQYDHEVQVRTVTKPGDDAGILRIEDGLGLALSGGCNPPHGKIDPYSAGAGAVLENAMNIAVKGARGLCIVNCLNFGNPERPEAYYDFKHSVLGLGDMARELDIPVVGGNVSFYNESDEWETAVAPTPTIGLVGTLKDTSMVPPMQITGKGQSIVLVGETREEMGGSEYYAVLGVSSGDAPQPPQDACAIVEAIVEAVESGLVTASHDVSHGGLVVALCEMAGDVGLGADLSYMDLRSDDVLFSESYGRALLATNEPDKLLDVFDSRGVSAHVIGVSEGENVTIKTRDRDVSLSLNDISEALDTLNRLMYA